MTDTKYAPMSEAKNEIVIYQPNEAIHLDVRLQDDTVWLTQLKIAELFGVHKAAISKHLKNIFASGELVRAATVSKMETVQTEGARTVVRRQEFFNLDVIIAVGYRVNSKRATQFRIWATKIIREYLLRGYSVNTRFNLLEDKVNRRISKVEDDVTELKEKVDFFVQTSQPPVRGVFYNGQVFDAHVFAAKFILSAKKSILLIDNWVDIVTLELLAKKAKGVAIEIITSKRGNKTSSSDVAKFNAQHGGLTISISNNFHDRFIAIDNKRLYLIGASLKDLGWKCFAFTELDAGEIPRLKARI